VCGNYVVKILKWLLAEGFGRLGCQLFGTKGDLKAVGLVYLGSWAGNFILRDCKEVRFGSWWWFILQFCFCKLIGR
jgi:hypothetical protein